MHYAHYHKRYGYYRSGRLPIGASGDFITAPEISQIFGELIGVWCINAWRAIGAPSPVKLVEFGPGRGVLMADLLRAARLCPEFLRAMRLELIETHPGLRDIQAQILTSAPIRPVWRQEFRENQGDGLPVLCLANEFFDAFPIRQFVRRKGLWHECHIANSTNGLTQCLVPRRELPPEIESYKNRHSKESEEVLEYSPLACALAARLARVLARNGGAGLIIDYGCEKPSKIQSLQAVKAHASVSVTEAPGDSDLTGWVQFGMLREIFERHGLFVRALRTQRKFLCEMGIEMRALRLIQAEPHKARQIMQGVKRLTAPESMGSLFKVLEVCSAEAPESAGTNAQAKRAQAPQSARRARPQ